MPLPCVFSLHLGKPGSIYPNSFDILMLHPSALYLVFKEYTLLFAVG